MAPSPRKRAADIDHDYTPTAKQARLARSNSRPSSSSSSSTHAERTLPPKFPSSQVGQPHSPRRALESRSRVLPKTPPNPRSHSPQLLPALKRGPDGDAMEHGRAPTVCKPAVLHRPHPDSKLCQDFHWVPYPLGLMPYDSWHNLHHRDDMQPLLPFRCPVCKQSRKATAHMRKLFLVAERLSWDDKLVAMPDKDRNEELNWAVNYELGILDPFVEDAENIPGGKNSRYNRFYPYRNEYEMKLAFKLIFMSEELSATSWALWISAQMHLQTMLEGGEQMDASPSAVLPPPTRMKDERLPTVTPAQQRTREPIETIDLTGSPEPVPKPTTGRSYGLSTPPSSLSKSPHSIAVAGGSHRKDGVYKTVAASIANFEEAGGPSAEPSPLRQIESYKTLQDFYSLLDKIERTSYVGALFLEAYAEKLRDDMCKDCWFKHNVNVDLF
ncbi:hypothetical protein HBI23_072550 [Parastagonospora nodorum]|nr:hypothetical protein HBI12_052590 [Parastagonospora nodorum]KAH5433554.1 hypothetical protein HBI47_089030 [Parastagonospora nodorum]KAH5665465.1 hypothetical protein HBI23_072550 [Parastagonospora nodorum]